ncbi:Vitamin B12 transporter BtuB [Brevundimonas sp. NIBR10]|uniref:TonB-dependent receptor n=1 Tax=Brevundimonas sp. NIBR10 TaxID=3015997 RepID=UPI0022F17088|nr:TonB-dependent receptor [Brevundimonas sp. NIBR10]WGM47322.1 Vitamin B12 transporter BtuB [Brevundimonas sp. NIBR10]
MNDHAFGAGFARPLRKLGLAGLLFATCLTAPTLVSAQQTASPSSDPNAASAVDDVVVTARRRQERLQEVPIAVTALSEEILEEKGVRDANDLGQVAPGLSVQNTTANRNNITYSIRGQGQAFGQNSPGVVPYFAEVPSFGDAIFDLQGIQVLKGPQGTLFGRNTTGGAILFAPKAPSEDFNGYLLGRVGNYSRRDVEFGVGGPILGERLLFRVAGQMLRRDGYTDNVTTGDQMDNEHRQAWRASITARPFDGFENTLLYQDVEVDEAGSGLLLSVITPTFSNEPIYTQLQTALTAQRARGPRSIATNYEPDFIKLDSQGWINTTSWRLNDHLTLKNIYSQRRFTAGQSYDLDGSPITVLHVTNPVGKKTKTTSEEFQAQFNFGNIDGVIGYFTEDSNTPIVYGFDTRQFVRIPGLLPNGGVIQAVNIAQGSSGSRAFYGQVDWSVTDQLTLTGGIRKTTDERSSGPSETFVLFSPLQPYPTGLTAAAGARLFASFDATTWNVAANYQFSQDLNVYATVRKGFKSGGFNGTAINPADQFFQPEEVTDYEFGIKGLAVLGDWQVRYAADVFYDDYTNIQRFVNLATVPASTVTRNAAAGSIAGIDLDLTIAPTDWFSASVQYTYLDAKYDSYNDALLGDLSSSRFPNTPEHQLNFTPRVEIPLPEGMGDLSALASVYYQSGIATDPANVPNGNALVALSSMGTNVDAYTRIDLRADWRNINGTGVSAAAYVRNATDEEYITGTNNQLTSQFGVATYLYGQPRFFGVELRFDFGT